MKIGGTNTIDFARVSKFPKFVIDVKSRDRKRAISLILLENNTPINLNNYTVTVAAKKSDGNDIFNDVTVVDAKNGICEVEVTEQMLALDTDLPCEIVLYGEDGTVATSSNFVIGKISSVRDENSIISSSEFTGLTKALSEVKNIDNRFKEVNSQLEHKVNKGNISVFDIDKNKGKFDQTYMADEFLQQMAGNTPINATPADKSVTQTKMAIPYVQAKLINLFDKSKVFEGFNVNNVNGSLISNPDFYSSDYIEIIGGETYSCTSKHPSAFYDSNKTFISGSSGTYTLVAPSNAKYIRISVHNPLLNSTQLEKGDSITNYVEYDYYLSNNVLNVASDYLNEIMIEKNKNLYPKLTKTKNLFNKNTVTPGIYVSYSTGELLSLDGASVSDYIEIEPNTEYVLTANNQNAFYDVNKKFISGTTSNPFTTPVNAKYVRVTTFVAKLDNQQLEKGSSPTSYEEFGYFIDNKLIKSEERITITPHSNIIDILLNNQGKTIYVENGEYDIIEIYKNYFGETFFDTLPQTGAPKHHYGLPLFNGTKLICSPNAHFSCHYKGTNQNVIWGFSGFACGNGYELNGLNIDASNVKYAVHDDYNTYNDTPYFVKVENCYITNNKQAIGGGLGKFGTYEYKNNFIHATNHAYDMRYHNHQNPTKCKLTFTGNYFPHTLRLSYYGQSEKDTTKCFVSNNFISSPILNDAETSDSTVNNMKVYAWNNSID